MSVLKIFPNVVAVYKNDQRNSAQIKTTWRTNKVTWVKKPPSGVHISLAANLSCVTGGRGKSSGVTEPVRGDSWIRPGTDISTLQLHFWTHFLQLVEHLSSQPHKVYLDRWPLRSCEETKQTNKIWEAGISRQAHNSFPWLCSPLWTVDSSNVLSYKSFTKVS